MRQKMGDKRYMEVTKETGKSLGRPRLSESKKRNPIQFRSREHGATVIAYPSVVMDSIDPSKSNI